MFLSRPSLFLPFAFILALGACAGTVKKESSYPTRQEGTDKIIYSNEKRETIWGDSRSLGDRLFGREDEDAKADGAGIGVNSFLWRASLDTISFMPIASADPFGGVILTEWFENTDAPGERFKVNIYIMDRQLRADGVRVAVFKQTRDKSAKGDGGWRDAPVPEDMSVNIENTILTRARELRVAQLGRDRK